MARREPESKPVPDHPYRYSALLYGALALLILALALLTGGSMLRALVIAAGFWLIATGWSSWQFRARLKARDSAVSSGDADE